MAEVLFHQRFYSLKNCTDRKKRDLPDTEGSTIDNDTITTVSGRLKILESAIGQSVHFRGKPKDYGF